MDPATTLPYIIVFLFGITVGSFLNVCILRLPGKESVVAVPSHCMSCGKRLRWFELIPIFSYLCLRGRCSVCKSRICPQYPLVEAANGVLWVLLLWRLGPTPLFFLACPLVSALLVLSVVDGRTREIPPGTMILILVLGGARLFLDLPHWHLYLLGAFVVSLPLYLVLIATGGRGVGGGDVKLMAVCGLFLGWKLILLALFGGCLLGSVIHLTRMALGRAGRELALGPYLSAGALLALLWGESALAWYLGLF